MGKSTFAEVHHAVTMATYPFARDPVAVAQITAEVVAAHGWTVYGYDLEATKTRLHALEIQRARFGISTPPEITIEIETLAARVRRLKQELGL